MEIKTIRSVEETVKLDLPYYSKTAAHVYCVNEKIECISVCHYDPCLSITLHGGVISSALDGEIISADEFNDTYMMVQSKLLNKIL